MQTASARRSRASSLIAGSSPNRLQTAGVRTLRALFGKRRIKSRDELSSGVSSASSDDLHSEATGMSPAALAARREQHDLSQVSRPEALPSEACQLLDHDKTLSSSELPRSASPTSGDVDHRAPSTTGSTSSHDGNHNQKEYDAVESPSEARQFAKKKYFSERATTKQSIFKKYFHPTFHQRSIQFKKIFSGTVNEDDRLLYTFSCAFQREILAQGRMFISQHHVSFYANIFTWETLFAVPVKDIRAITKERVAKVFPNSIQIETHSGEKLFFASFVNREKTFTVLQTVWHSMQEDKTISPEDLWELLNPEEDEQKFHKDKKSVSTDSMNKNNSEPILSPLSIGGAPDAEFPSILESCEPVECPCDGHYGRTLLDKTLDLGVDDIYTLLFTDTPWFIRFCERLKKTGYAASEWTLDKESIRQRTVTYTVALNHAMAPKSCTVTETQICSHLTNDSFVVKKETHNAGVPYADSFVVLVTYCITRVKRNSARIRVHGGVEYRKSIFGMIKPFIEKNTNQGLDEHYSALSQALDDEARARRSSSSTEEISETNSNVECFLDSPKLQRARSVPPFARSSSQTAPQQTSWFSRLYQLPLTDVYAIAIIGLLTALLFVNVQTYWQQSRIISTSVVNGAPVTLEALAHSIAQIKDELKNLKSIRQEL